MSPTEVPLFFFPALLLAAPGRLPSSFRSFLAPPFCFPAVLGPSLRVLGAGGGSCYLPWLGVLVVTALLRRRYPAAAKQTGASRPAGRASRRAG